MSTIRLIGIGSCGANIVKQFSTYDVYDLTYIDNERHDFGEGAILPKIPKNKIAHEEYDSISYEWLGIEGESQEIQIFISGASDISGCLLQVLKHLKEKSCQITLFYIKPELKFSSELQKIQDKITFSIAQEYTRSGIIDNFIIFDNAVMGQLVGKTTISNYFPSINSKIAQFVHTFNFCNKNEPVFGQKNTFLDITRIGCLGYGILNSDINLFFDLKSNEGDIIFPLEIQYNFLIPEKDIKENENLMTDLLEIVEKEQEKYKSINYGVYEITGEQDEISVLVYLRTSNIQLP